MALQSMAVMVVAVRGHEAAILAALAGFEVIVTPFVADFVATEVVRGLRLRPQEDQADQAEAECQEVA